MNEAAFLEALAQFAPAVRQAFIDAVQTVTDNVVLAQVVEALDRGDADAAWRAMGFQQAAFNGLIAQITATFNYGGMAMTASMPQRVQGVPGVQMFNIRDRRAEEWLRERSSTLITGLEDDMRTAVREVAQGALAQGRNPRKTALDLVGRVNPATGHREGGLVGLSGRDRTWADGARQKLLTLDESYFDMKLRDKRFDRTVAAAIKAGKPLPVDTVNKLVDRYKDNALRNRGELIARTETLAALNRSEYESTLQALDRNKFPPEAALKKWSTTGDQKVRHSHVALGLLGFIRIDEVFVSPVTGARMMHPGDTSLGAGADDVGACRCRLTYKIDFSWGVE